jgi:geranylgeranyl diphosphate synthase type I
MNKINGLLGKKYLSDYLKKSDPLFERFLKKKENESRMNDPLDGEIIKRFTEVAKLGKKIRGALVVLGYQIGAGKIDKNIIDTSLFVELFHAGVLVHDDIQDRGDFRRGLPTLHRQFEKLGSKLGVTIDKYHYGESIAIDAGISAYFYSFDKLLKSKFPQDRLIETALLYSKYVQRVSDGQSLDITGMTSKKVEEKYVLTMLKLKAAEYTGVMPLLCGASLAGMKDATRLKAMEEYGLCFGWAFQIQDDLLGLYGNEIELGKVVGSDIKEGKNTLFTFYLSKHGNKDQIAFMKKTLGNQNASRKDIKNFKRILKETGSYDYVIKTGWNYVERGRKQIPYITHDRKIQDILESLIYYMMERTL